MRRPSHRTARLATNFAAAFALLLSLALAGCDSQGPGYVEHILPGREAGDPTVRLAAVQWGAAVGDLQAGIAPEVDAGEVAWYDPDARPLAGLYLRNLSSKHDLIIPHPAQVNGFSSYDDASLRGVRRPQPDVPGYDLTMLLPDGKTVPDWLPMRHGNDPVEMIRLRPHQTIVLSASLDPAEWGASGATKARFIFAFQNTQADGFIIKGQIDETVEGDDQPIHGAWIGRIESAALEVHYRKTLPNSVSSPVAATRPTTNPATQPTADTPYRHTPSQINPINWPNLPLNSNGNGNSNNPTPPSDE